MTFEEIDAWADGRAKDSEDRWTTTRWLGYLIAQVNSSEKLPPIERFQPLPWDSPIEYEEELTEEQEVELLAKIQANYDKLKNGKHS